MVGRGIERGAGRGLEEVGGASTESILPGGGEEIGVYRGLGCAVFGDRDVVPLIPLFCVTVLAFKSLRN